MTVVRIWEVKALWNRWWLGMRKQKCSLSWSFHFLTSWELCTLVSNPIPPNCSSGQEIVWPKMFFNRTINNKCIYFPFAGISDHMQKLADVQNFFQGSVQLGAFGGISWKRLAVRGSWKGLPLLLQLYQNLKGPTSNRSFEKLTKKSGKLFGCKVVKFYMNRFSIWLWWGTQIHIPFVVSFACRWQTANEFTQYSALYPDLFGLGIAFCYELFRKGNTDAENLGYLAEFGELILSRMPSEEDVVAAAQDCFFVVSCYHLDILCQRNKLGQIVKDTIQEFILSGLLFKAERFHRWRPRVEGHWALDCTGLGEREKV